MCIDIGSVELEWHSSGWDLDAVHSSSQVRWYFDTSVGLRSVHGVVVSGPDRSFLQLGTSIRVRTYTRCQIGFSA